jgi:hypothetical protein
MGDLTSKKLDPELAKTISVTWFIYPGSHDAATYKSGLADFSYQCQEKNLYEQMMTGQRAFDLRLAPENGGKTFMAVHGVAKNTADDFNSGPKEAKESDLAGMYSTEDTATAYSSDSQLNRPNHAFCQTKSV